MTIRTQLTATTLVCVSTLGMAQANTAEPQVTPYQYGQELDIAKVVAMTEPLTAVCQVITAEMKFLNSAGQLEAISYLKLSDACTRNQN